MARPLEHIHMTPHERATVEAMVDRYRDNTLSRDAFIREMRIVGYEARSVESYAELVDSTLDRTGRHAPPARAWWEPDPYHPYPPR